MTTNGYLQPDQKLPSFQPESSPLHPLLTLYKKKLGFLGNTVIIGTFLCCNLANPRHVLPALDLSMALAVRKAECGDLHPRPLGLATWQSAKRGDEIEQIGPKIGFNSGQVISMLLQDTIPTNSNHIQSTDVNVVGKTQPVVSGLHIRGCSALPEVSKCDTALVAAMTSIPCMAMSAV